MPDTGRAEPTQRRKSPGLSAIWIGLLAVAVLWFLLPLWETAFIQGRWPGIYWWFLAENVAMDTIGIWIAVVAVLEAVMVVLLIIRKRAGPGPRRPAKAARDDLAASCALGFTVLLLLFARAGVAALRFTPRLDRHMGEVETGQHMYFLAHHTAVNAWDVFYSFVQCDPMGVWCMQLQEVRTDGTQNGEDVTPQATLSYNPDEHSIDVAEEGGPYFVYKLDSEPVAGE